MATSQKRHHVIFRIAFEAKFDIKNKKILIFPYWPNITIILNFMAPFDPVANNTCQNCPLIIIEPSN